MVVTAVLWLASGGVAQAHPVLLRSTPSDGQTVQAAPRQIDLWFSEPPTAAGIEVSLSDRDGRAIPLGTTRIADRGIHVVVSGFPELPRSVYELRWSVVSKYDLHRLQGTLVFGVGLAATSTGEPARSVTGPAATVVDVVLGWMDLAATSVLCGWAFLATALARRPKPALPEPVVATMLGLAVAFGFLSVFTSLVRSGRQLSEAKSSESGLAILIGSGQLTRWTLRELALVGVLVVLIRRVRGLSAGPLGTSLLVVLLLADIVLRSASSHAQAGPVSLVVLSLHQAAGLAWIGGLGLLAVLTGQLRENRGQAFRLWKAFGPLAAGCVAVLSVTGLLLAGRQVASLDAALGTLYGKALLVKLAVVAAAMMLGFRHARRLHPWLIRRPDRQPKTPTARGQAISALLGVGVLLFAVVLAVTPPARGPQFSKPMPVATRATYQVDDLLITVALAPNAPGRSLLLVDVVSSRRPVPGPISAVTADLGTSTGIVLRRTQGAVGGDSRWQAAVDVEATGDLPLRIAAVRGHPGSATVSGTWVVPSGLAPRAVVVSNSPLTPWTNAAAALTALLALTVAGALVHRHRRRVAPGSEQLSGAHELEDAATHR
ncbi:copper resistance protein CopC/CopD [Kribbella sp. NBC_01484]|uniref:copper resistance CopC/CopD family protein n=1 Tax=Kribbella sp. NBC_01484 TaxID=2903579 RepID=UPI002E33BFAC|nr:copper resistance protein CopC [Kribbella sp. NBC_01484]